MRCSVHLKLGSGWYRRKRGGTHGQTRGSCLTRGIVSEPHPEPVWLMVMMSLRLEIDTMHWRLSLCLPVPARPARLVSALLCSFPLEQARNIMSMNDIVNKEYHEHDKQREP